MTALPDYPNPMFNSHYSSESLHSTSYGLTCRTSSPCSNLSKPEPVEKKSVAIQSELEMWDMQIDCQLTTSLWNIEFPIAELEQQNKNVRIEFTKMKVSVRCANRSWANAKTNADRAESKLEFSQKVNSDLFGENK